MDSDQSSPDLLCIKGYLYRQQEEREEKWMFKRREEGKEGEEVMGIVTEETQ